MTIGKQSLCENCHDYDCICYDNIGYERKEIWKPIIFKGVDYTGLYEVNNYGHVRSIKKIKVIMLKQQTNKKGYKSIKISKGNKVKNCRIHVLVMEAFRRSKKVNEVIDHIDDDKSNNRYDNLQFLTNRENCTKYTIKVNSLPTGVYLFKGKPRASISLIGNGNKSANLGMYPTVELAEQAYKIALFTVEKRCNVTKEEMTDIINKYRSRMNLAQIKLRN